MLSSHHNFWWFLSLQYTRNPQNIVARVNTTQVETMMCCPSSWAKISGGIPGMPVGAPVGAPGGPSMAV